MYTLRESSTTRTPGANHFRHQHPRRDAVDRGPREDHHDPTHQVLSQPAAGFTLVEVLVSIMILSVASLALGIAAGPLQPCGHGHLLRGATRRAALTSEVGRLERFPSTPLVAGTTCVNVTAAAVPSHRVHHDQQRVVQGEAVTVVGHPPGATP